MKFLEIVEKLQEENKGKIVIIKSGMFFIGVGKDAIILNKLIGLKLTCMKPKMCKVGFLVKSVEKYIKILEEKGKSFVIYIKDNETIEELYKFDGEEIFEEKTNIGCDECENKKETDSDVLERVRNLGK